jgi:hypothetical protein
MVTRARRADAVNLHVEEKTMTLDALQIEDLVRKLDTVDLVLRAISQETAHPERTIHAGEILVEVRGTLASAMRAESTERMVSQKSPEVLEVQ